MIQTDELEKGQLRLLEVDNRILVPIDTTIRLIITSADVIHSFAMPSLGVKVDAIPGRLNETSFSINRPGVFYGQCSELCGILHGFMVRGEVNIATKTEVFENFYHILPTLDLSMRENLMLNIACPLKGNFITSKSVIQVSKLMLLWLKLYCMNLIRLVFETWNLSLFCKWLSGLTVGYGIKNLQDKSVDGLTSSQLEPESKEPKRDVNAILDTIGLSKGRNPYGNRGIIVPASILLYDSSNMLRRGRIPGILLTNIRRYSDGGHFFVPDKLVNLSEFCSKYPDKYVDRNIYKIMLDKDMYYLAYHKLKPTLDGLNSD